jgi:hypothetical protein
MLLRGASVRDVVRAGIKRWTVYEARNDLALAREKAQKS